MPSFRRYQTGSMYLSETPCRSYSPSRSPQGTDRLVEHVADLHSSFLEQQALNIAEREAMVTAMEGINRRLALLATPFAAPPAVRRFDLSLLGSVRNFSGLPGEDVLAFVTAFEIECRTVDWPADQYLRGIVPKVIGNASDWHEVEGVRFARWATWREQLLRTFGGVINEDRWYQMAEGRVRQDDETPLIYTFSKLRLATSRQII